MTETFEEILMVGGKSNSLGRVNEVIELVLDDRNKLDDLYSCMFSDDAWARMRAADAFEKVCREHPDWILPYIDKFPNDLATSSQPSIQWHLAQIYRQVNLNDEQKSFAINWLKNLLTTTEVDWIVAANAMDTLVQFVKDDSFSLAEMTQLLKIQQSHKSNSVAKRATKLLAQISEN